MAPGRSFGSAASGGGWSALASRASLKGEIQVDVELKHEHLLGGSNLGGKVFHRPLTSTEVKQMRSVRNRCFTPNALQDVRARTPRLPSVKRPSQSNAKRRGQWCNQPHIPNAVNGNLLAPSSVTSAPAKPILGPNDKLALIFTVFDADSDGLLCYEELCAFLSIVTRKNWEAKDAFDGWCMRFGCDPNRGLPFPEFSRLVTDLGGNGYADATFRHLGFESLGSNPPEDPADLRMELVRAAMDGLDGEALASLWPDDFARAAAAEALGMDFRQARGHSYALEPGQVCAALPALLAAWQKFAEAAQHTIEKWRVKVKRHLEGAELDRMVPEWAMYDAAQGAGIASLTAQCSAAKAFFERLLSEPTAVGVWRLARAVAELQSTLEAAQAYGLHLPLDTMCFMEEVAHRIGSGDIAQLPMPPPGSMPALNFLQYTKPLKEIDDQEALRPSSSPPGGAGPLYSGKFDGDTLDQGSSIQGPTSGSKERNAPSPPVETSRSSPLQKSPSAKKAPSAEKKRPKSKEHDEDDDIHSRHNQKRFTAAVPTQDPRRPKTDRALLAQQATEAAIREEEENERMDREAIEAAALFEAQRQQMMAEAEVLAQQQADRTEEKSHRRFADLADAQETLQAVLAEEDKEAGLELSAARTKTRGVIIGEFNEIQPHQQRERNVGGGSDQKTGQEEDATPAAPGAVAEPAALAETEKKEEKSNEPDQSLVSSQPFVQSRRASGQTVMTDSDEADEQLASLLMPAVDMTIENAAAEVDGHNNQRQ